jgi:universal stress protein A
MAGLPKLIRYARLFFFAGGDAAAFSVAVLPLSEAPPLHFTQMRREAMHEIKRILVATRIIKYCENALHFGISLSKECGATLYVLHVMDDPFRRSQGWNLSVPTFISEEAYEKRVNKTRKYLEAIVNAENLNGIKIVELIRKGEPANILLQVSKEEHIDLIIMPVHEEGRLEHFLFGYGNEKIIRKLPCSIVLVKKEPAVFGAVY